MSRSSKRSPFTGITTSTTEKQEKRRANRRLRRKVGQKVGTDSEDIALPLLRDVSNPWWMSKDGKFRFSCSKLSWLMRK